MDANNTISSQCTREVLHLHKTSLFVIYPATGNTIETLRSVSSLFLAGRSLAELLERTRNLCILAPGKDFKRRGPCAVQVHANIVCGGNERCSTYSLCSAKYSRVFSYVVGGRYS